MGAPVLIEVDVIANPVDIAIQEYEVGVIPITVKRTVPPKQEIGRLFLRKGSK
jgi:DNA-directed RNA polymerase subunit K/omega